MRQSEQGVLWAAILMVSLVVTAAGAVLLLRNFDDVVRWLGR